LATAPASALAGPSSDSSKVEKLEGATSAQKVVAKSEQARDRKDSTLTWSEWLRDWMKPLGPQRAPAPSPEDPSWFWLRPLDQLAR
jgi:hypothetical protein